jgi:hypothetical protein
MFLPPIATTCPLWTSWSPLPFVAEVLPTSEVETPMRRSHFVPMRWMVIYNYEVPGGALNLSFTKLLRLWSPWKSFPLRKNPHGRIRNRIRGLMISSQKLWPLDQEADQFKVCNENKSRSQWPRGLRCGSAVARKLRLWVRIQLEVWVFVSCECCVLSGRGLCVGLITRPEDFYRVSCVQWVWLQSPVWGDHDTESGRSAKGEKLKYK